MSLCRHCFAQPIKHPSRNYCSELCMRAKSRAKHREVLHEFRLSIDKNGYDVESRSMFEAAAQQIRIADPRAWYYRLILDLVDGKPSRTPLNDSIRADRACRSVVFPEPNRTYHYDTDGFRRPGDYFSLRQPFEMPRVPLAAYYRVQLLGDGDKGDPNTLEPLDPIAEELRVLLPPSPFNDAWRHVSWGREQTPAQLQKKKDLRIARKARQNHDS